MKRAWVGLSSLALATAVSACSLFSDPEVAKGLVYGAGTSAAAGGIVGGVSGGMAGAGTGMAKGAAQGTANQILSTIPGASSTTPPVPNQASTYPSPYSGQAVSSLGGGSPEMPSMTVPGQALTSGGAALGGVPQATAPAVMPLVVNPEVPQAGGAGSSGLRAPAQSYGRSSESQSATTQAAYVQPAPQTTPNGGLASRDADDERGTAPGGATAPSGWNVIEEQNTPGSLAVPSRGQIEEGSVGAVPARSDTAESSTQSSGWQLLP